MVRVAHGSVRHHPLGITLSMDAFAVGVSLRAVGADILSSSLIIAAATFLVCLAALRIGRRFGIVLGDRAQMAGGLVLVAIGVKALLS
ncbi:manganese efflux pump [Slackia exigua]|uniref:manganese efflux pump n=1 Tax=Slackia exigua TaxID=84109 RepID=UPI0023F5595C|nr:manganese efflux pump [Slackia exigua]